MSACIAGIGSRKTPSHIQDQMFEIGDWCRQKGWWVRSGHAPGADTAFELGAKDHTIIYLPWRGFNGGTEAKHIVVFDNVHRQVRQKAIASVNKFHPNPVALSGAVMKLMARNYFQVMGTKIKPHPVTAVVCWTPRGKGGGGTGQAIRIAKHHGIPVLDLGNEQPSLFHNRKVPWATGSVLERLVELDTATRKQSRAGQSDE